MGAQTVPPFEPQPQNLFSHLAKKSPQKNGVLYLHVPFCAKICSFCSLRRTLNQPVSDYGQKMCQELSLYGQIPYVNKSQFDSVYFGGGTPTTLSAQDLELVLHHIAAHFTLQKKAEISLETSLSELSLEKAKRIQQAGANRLSIGIQTFKSEGRKRFNRRGDGDFAIQHLKSLQQSGIKNISIDLIYNYEGQSVADVIRDVTLADTLGCSGFSMYSLINMNQKNGLKTGDGAQEKRLFDALVNEGLKRGFHFFETTKMVRHDEYKYIQHRLEGADTIPIGAGAGGSLSNLLVMNPIDIVDYNESIRNFHQKMGRVRTANYARLERYKGYFQRCIIPKALLEPFPQIEKIINGFLADDLIAEEACQYRYTKDGVYWGNNISATLIEAIGNAF